MVGELDVLGIVSRRLTDLRIDFMLTGSFAMAFYATPRMTRDIDVVVALRGEDVSRLVEALTPDFYVDAAMAQAAVAAERLFNVLHLDSGIKVDFIVRKTTEYRQLEFSRRKPMDLPGIGTWIVSREDLILSKLVWARDTGSELQRRDVRALLDESVDVDYIERWAGPLGVQALLRELRQ
jgi:hypothetical protein